MRDSQKTRKQLITELQETRQQLELLAASEVERRQAGEALRESEEKFFKAFRSSPDMIIIATIKDSKYIEVNDSFMNTTGYTREELIGHTVDEFALWVHPEEHEKMTQLLQEQGKIRNEEYSFRVKSGEIRRWLCSAEIINIGGEACMIAVAVDITERKWAEEALRQSEDKFFKAFHSSPSIIAITNAKNGKFIEVNESFTNLIGYTREETIGHNADELGLWVNEKDRYTMQKLLKTDGRIHHEEFQFRTKSGEIRTWLFSSEPIYLNNESCSIAVILDITLYRRAEQALRESEEKFSVAFRSSPEMIAIARLEDGKYIDVNDSFVNNTGYSREELIGHHVDEVNMWAIPEEQEKMNQLIIEKGHVRNEEYSFRMKSGEIHRWLCSADIINIGGKACTIAVATDITDYQRIETQAREAENLKEVDRLRIELLANVSHELRTPLASIKGFATMLLDYDKRLTPREKREYLETIDKNTDRLAELIEQLLEMSRLEAGMISINKIPADVIALCRDVIAEAHARAPDHIFVLDLPSKLPGINIDERRIRQVLDNILDNAVKYSDTGTEIALSVRNTGPDLLFTVADHGVGIPPKDLPHVFERLFHHSQRKASRVPGAGLGLPISKGLVEAHGGKIWLESEEGAGTRCSFTLPL
jgi:PAS domain S-box-containing protein